MTTTAVIGATGDVGAGIAAVLLEQGHRVLAVGRSRDRLEALAGRLGNPGALIPVPGSLATPADASALATALGQAGGPSRIVVSVNGPQSRAPVASLDPAALRQLLDDNLLTHLHAAQALLPILPEGGTYLAIGGGMADFVVPGFGAVSMAQAAQRVLIRYLARESGRPGVAIRELLLQSMINGHTRRAEAAPEWLTDRDVGQHVAAILADPPAFPGPILTLRNRDGIGKSEGRA